MQNKSLKQFLCEDENLTLERGVEVLQMLFGDQFVIDGDRVNSTQSLSLNFSHKRWFKGTHMPVKFGKIQGNFNVTNMDFNYNKELPIYVKGNCYLTSNGFKTIEHFPEYIGAILSIYDNPEIKTYSNIHKHVKYCGKGIVIDPLHCPYLGFLLVKDNLSIFNIKSYLTFDISVVMGDPHNEEAFQAKQIINDYKVKNGDLLDCKAELIEQGLTEFAKI
jgi:hypothetical protein